MTRLENGDIQLTISYPEWRLLIRAVAGQMASEIIMKKRRAAIPHLRDEHARAEQAYVKLGTKLERENRAV